MNNLTFGEQVKIMLSRKGMTIKELAENFEEQTGKKMSRQNLTQRLGRDNFQEQDMRLIASILGCPFTLSIIAEPQDVVSPPVLPTSQSSTAAYVTEGITTSFDSNDSGEEIIATGLNVAGRIKKSVEANQQKQNLKPREIIVAKSKSIEAEEAVKVQTPEVDMTIGDIVELHKDLDELELSAKTGEMPVHEIKEELDKPLIRVHEDKLEKWKSGFKPNVTEDEEEEDLVLGERNPYTGREYQTNSVRMHPTRIGYVQVYDRAIHKWTDMTEWAFLGYQERKKNLLGRNYEPPIYLD